MFETKLKTNTSSKVSKYVFFSGPYFPLFGLNTKVYGVNLSIQSKCWKMPTRKTPYLDIFHAGFLQIVIDKINIFLYKYIYFYRTMYADTV